MKHKNKIFLWVVIFLIAIFVILIIKNENNSKRLNPKSSSKEARFEGPKTAPPKDLVPDKPL